MGFREELIAVLLGTLQGIFEWLPISSEGNITVLLQFLGLAAGHSGLDPARLSLFLHVGTAVSATVYYRDELADVLGALPEWRPATAFEGSTAELSYLALASLMSAVTGAVALTALEAFVGEADGGALIILIGVLLVVTGLLQRFSGSLAFGLRDDPDWVDAVAVGSLQGLAILPGVSRSGVTSSALLFRGHDGPSAFRLSFLLSIPAALGAGALVLLTEGGVPLISPTQALLALAAAAVVGYLTIDALMRIVERFSFWGICLALGGVMIVGGALLVV